MCCFVGSMNKSGDLLKQWCRWCKDPNGLLWFRGKLYLNDPLISVFDRMYREGLERNGPYIIIFKSGLQTLLETMTVTLGPVLTFFSAAGDYSIMFRAFLFVCCAVSMHMSLKPTAASSLWVSLSLHTLERAALTQGFIEQRGVKSTLGLTSDVFDKRKCLCYSRNNSYGAILKANDWDCLTIVLLNVPFTPSDVILDKRVECPRNWKLAGYILFVVRWQYLWKTTTKWLQHPVLLLVFLWKEYNFETPFKSEMCHKTKYWLTRAAN